MNQYGSGWGPDEAPLYQPTARPPHGTGYPPQSTGQYPTYAGPESVSDYDASADYGFAPDPEMDKMARRRKRGRRVVILFWSVLLAVVALVVLINLFEPAKPAVVVPAPSAVPVPTMPIPAAPQPQAQAPRLAPGVFGDGTYEVGQGPGLIEPGRYRYQGGAALAYWARLKDTSGESSAIIANGMPKGPTTITIKKTDGAVEFRGDATWQRVG
jgi:hypothetical protein